jgi:hypothetical protein
MTPNQILGDIMTDDAYRDDNEKEEKEEKKDEKKDEKKKSVAFKATSSLKGKAKQDTSSDLVKMMTQALMIWMMRR